MSTIIEAGNKYTCDLVASIGLFGKHDMQVIVDVDTPTSFHGYGRLKGDSVNILGIKLDANQQVNFSNGVIDGDELSCTISKGSVSASFKVHVSDDGSIKGTADAMGIVRVRLAGKVSDIKPL